MRLRILASATLVASVLAAPSSAHIITGNIYLTDDTFNKVYGINPNVWQLNTILDGAFQQDPSIDSLRSIAFPDISGLAGPILMTNSSNNTLLQVDEVDPFFFVSTIAGASEGIDGPAGGNGIAIGPLGHVFLVNSGNGNNIVRLDVDYTNPVVWADAADGLIQPEGTAFLADGSMMVANYGGGNLIHVSENGGNALGGTSTVFDTLPAGEEPVAIAVRNNFDIYVRTWTGKIYRYRDGFAGTRTLLGDYSTVDGFGSISMSFDHTSIFTITNGGQDIVVVDPAVGSSVIGMTSPSWALTSLSVVSNQHPPGSMWEWGGPTAGSGGFEPMLFGNGQASIGGSISLDASDFIGGTPITLVMGIASQSSFIVGGQVYIDLGQQIFTFVQTTSGTVGGPGEGDASFPFAIPTIVSLVHQKLFFQAAGPDPGAPAGISMSNPVTMYIGL